MEIGPVPRSILCLSNRDPRGVSPVRESSYDQGQAAIVSGKEVT